MRYQHAHKRPDARRVAHGIPGCKSQAAQRRTGTACSHPKGAHESTPECGDAPVQNLTVAADGRLVIPKAMREAMRLGADGYVTACVSSGELRVVSRDAAIRRMQRVARSLKKPGTSVVDEFLAERRALWGES
ncbi:MAG: hypothetical protein OXF72_08945 [Gammaproteobacteria bacterium]|nr:hypothetical protein [Gammaproteobacteria bacterium]